MLYVPRANFLGAQNSKEKTEIKKKRKRSPIKPTWLLRTKKGISQKIKIKKPIQYMTLSPNSVTPLAPPNPIPLRNCSLSFPHHTPRPPSSKQAKEKRRKKAEKTTAPIVGTFPSSKLREGEGSLCGKKKEEKRSYIRAIQIKHHGRESL